MGKLSREDVLRLAQSIHLTLSEEEIAELQDKLSETLKFISNLTDLDTSNIDTSTDVSGRSNISFEDGTPSTRTLSQEDALRNAPHKKDGYFVVPKILDKG